MSYCRFSSDDFNSDVYCYEAVTGGFVIHVAHCRVVGDIPKAQHLLAKETMEEFFVAHRTQLNFLETAEREPIGLEYDGETFVEDGPQEAADRLESLLEAGYQVPQYAIDALREEQE